MKCRNCQSLCIKKGYQAQKQKYYCKLCKLHQLETYKYKCCTKADEEMIIRLNNEGVGISGISRITGMSKANVVNKIKLIAEKIKAPALVEKDQEYEVDELQTFIQNKDSRSYIIYAINKSTKAVINFVIGSRTKENIATVIESVRLLGPRRIFTDKLNIYPGLIERDIHVASAHKINHIERFNLTLRTHLKRIARKTICFSRSMFMLENCLKIYLWG